MREITDAGYDIWIKELNGGPRSRVTLDEGHDRMPRWAPDGESVTFLSDRAGDLDVWSRRTDGTGEAELVFDSESRLADAFRSPDGEWIVVRTAANPNIGQSVGARDILALRPGVDSVPLPLLATQEFAEQDPAISPGGRWLAYTSDETGGFEVFVRPFPDVESGKWQVSTEGGMMPLWAHSGRELFFRNSDTRDVMAAQIETDSGFQAVGLETLFTVPRGCLLRAGNDITPDDERFLMVRPYGGEADETATEVIVVENFFEELKEQVGG